MKYLDNYYYLDNIEHFDDLKGYKGPSGSQGIKGVQGNVGLKGLSGAVGIDGIKGSPGFTGDRGSKGDKGNRGEIGNVGDQGIKGVKGPQGPDGVTGPRGNRGTRGKVGSIGDKGLEGEQGLTGVPGSSGTSFSINDFDVKTNKPDEIFDNSKKPLMDSKKPDAVEERVKALSNAQADKVTQDDNEGKSKEEVIDDLEYELQQEGLIPKANEWFRIPHSSENNISGASRCPNNGAIVGVRSNRLYQIRLGTEIWKPVGCKKCIWCGVGKDFKPKYCAPKMDWLTGGGCWPCGQEYGWRHWGEADVHQKNREYEILCTPMPSSRKDDDDEYTVNFNQKAELIDEYWHTNNGGNKNESLKRYPFYLPD